ncbi:MAG TPA: DUF6580 family putative transport protein [Candidatus Acidoferrum sp.]|nr:DUF6580 family putative transport protein [Candidatus Acidoferrum sp.]
MKAELTEKQLFWMKTGIAAMLVLLAAVLRILPHPWNLTPIGAMALFSGSVFKERWLRFMFPLLALFAGDATVGFHKLMFVVYLSFLINVAIGMWLGENRKPLRIAGATLFGAVQFFLITNFAVWTVFTTYPKTLAGLATCYVAAIPFFWNTLAGDMIYTALLFGGYALAERSLPHTDRLPGPLR